MDLITLDKFNDTKSNIFFNKKFDSINLSNCDLSNKKFYFCDLSELKLENCNLTNCSFENCLLDGISLKNSKLFNANLKSASMRNCNLENCNLKGAYFYGAILENANLKNIQTDENTKWLNLYCPPEGAFIGYKKALNNKIITLLILKDSSRSSATKKSCRTNKAKVLKITDFKETTTYDTAWSLADDNFCYKVGEIVTVSNFNNNRWFDSTTGIHFWLTKEEAIQY